MNCTSLVTAPNIPSNVTSLFQTFSGCSNLEGNIYIHSENITESVATCFSNYKRKNVYIPFENNGINTETYKAFINAGYDTQGTKYNVYLMDINSL